jgi:hypothetical protein
MKLPTLTHPTALELSERKQKLGSELHTSLFFSQAENKIIIAPVYELTVGLYCEQETPEVLPFDSSIEEIGQRAKASLMQCEKVIKDSRNVKESDWPAYKVSRAKKSKGIQGRLCWHLDTNYQRQHPSRRSPYRK